MTSTEIVQTIRTLLPPGHPWGQQIIHLPCVDSTNTYAKALAQRGAPSGTVVLADTQSGGRGRLGRSFFSPAEKGLYLSVILRPNCAAQQLMHLTCAAGVAAAEAMAEAAGIEIGLKWTNDLVVGKQKLGGILTELGTNPATHATEFAIVGIGINCSHTQADLPPELRAMATSLALVGGKSDRLALAAALIDRLSHMDARLLTDRVRLIEEFAARCITVGQDIRIVRGDTVRDAHAYGIGADGSLLVSFADGTRDAVTSGEVSIRGMYGYL